MSTEIEFRQHIRNRKKKQKIRRNFAVVILSVIIITVFCLCVKGVFTKINNKKEDDSEFIFNGYVYPQLPPKKSDILLDAVNNDGKKVAYLTFDDGPNNSITPLVLDELRRYNVKATFFMVGTMIEENPDMARRVFEEGHCLANHSYSHEYSELYADANSFMSQIDKTYELIMKVTNKNNYPKIFRFPGGGYDAGTYGPQKQEYKKVLEEAGYKYCDWNSLTGDAESKNPSQSYLIDRLKATSKEKEDIVILMHDAVTKKSTAKALSEVIEYLMSQGYSFDTLDNV